MPSHSIFIMVMVMDASHNDGKEEPSQPTWNAKEFNFGSQNPKRFYASQLAHAANAYLQENEDHVHPLSCWFELKFVPWHKLIEGNDQIPRCLGRAGVILERMPEQALQGVGFRHQQRDQHIGVA